MLNDKSLEIGIVVKIDNSIPFGFCRSAKLQHLVTNQLPSFIVQRIGLISQLQSHCWSEVDSMVARK